jgi:Mrp family chromosome partitioning ATPase
VLHGTAVPDVVRSAAYPGVQVVVAGPPLTSRMQEVNLYKNLVPYFSEFADVVLVDAPPLRANTDIRLLASSVGAVVLVVRAGSVAPAELHATVESLSRLETKLLGTVLTFSATPLFAGGPPSITPASRARMKV